MKLFKYEFYHLILDRAVWAVLMAIIALGLLIAYAGRHNFIGIPVEGIIPLILCNPFLTMWTGVVLAPVFFGLDFQNRTLNIAVSSGYSRIKIFITKVFLYYLYGILVLFISNVCMVWISCGNLSFIRLGEKFVLLPLIYCATITIPMLMYFIFNDMFAATAINVIFTFTMQRLMENEIVSDIMFVYPPCLQMNILTLSTWTEIFTSILINGIYIVIGSSICIYALKTRELK